jgi:hypothetical protein
VITTQKDQVRLGSLTSTLPQSLPLLTANLRVEIEEETAAIEWLVERASKTP